MRILLIEDDEDVARVVTAGLKEVGHVVVHAGDGETGQALAEAGCFDVMIFDRQLPGGVDGANILEAIRRQANHTPVLFLSGLGDLSDWVAGLDAGGDDYLVKPFAVNELRARVEALRRPAQVDNPAE